MTTSNGPDGEPPVSRTEESRRITVKRKAVKKYAVEPIKDATDSKAAVPEWENWSRFRLWRHTRPLWGSILMIVAGALVLWGPINLLQFAFLPGNSLWAALLVGALLVVMGIIQLFAPSYSLITGAIGIVLSLISLLVALGGLGIGMILGITGGALGVAWKPIAPVIRSTPVQPSSPPS